MYNINTLLRVLTTAFRRRRRRKKKKKEEEKKHHQGNECNAIYMLINEDNVHIYI